MYHCECRNNTLRVQFRMIQSHQHVQFPETHKNQHFALTGLNQSTDASIKPCEGGEPEAEMCFPYMDYHVSDNASDSSGWIRKLNHIRYKSLHTHTVYTEKEDLESRSTLKVNTLKLS